MHNAHVVDFYFVQAVTAKYFNRWLAYEVWRAMHSKELRAMRDCPVAVH